MHACACVHTGKRCADHCEGVPAAVNRQLAHADAYEAQFQGWSASEEKVDKIQHIFYESAVMKSFKFSPLKMEQSLSKFDCSLSLQFSLKKLT